MAFQLLQKLDDDVTGLRVEIVEFGEKLRGIIKSFDAENGKLALLLDGSKSLQLFYQNDCEACALVEDVVSVARGRLCSLHEVDSEGEGAAAADVQKGGDVPVRRATLSVDQMKKVFKEVRPERGRREERLTSGGRRGRDTHHLRNFVQIDLKSLLCGAPPTGEEGGLMIVNKGN